MRSVRARAHASSANLGHGFDVFAVAITAGFDEVELSVGHRGATLSVEGDGAALIPSRMSRNTAGVALARLLRDHPGIDVALRIRIMKGVPTGGGLGSSAASAAAAVVAADRLFDLRLPRPRLVAYAAHGETASAGAPHADNVAAALCGGFVIIDPADPTRLERVPTPRGLRFAIATPRLRLTTRAARHVLPGQLPLDEHSRGCARAAMIVAAMAAGRIAALGAALEGSFTDRARAGLVPGFADVCAEARAAGAAGATLSGAGPSIVAVVDMARARPAAVANAMRDAFRHAGVDAEARVARVAGPARVVEVR